MSTTTKYDWDITDYGVAGWNGILQSFQTDIDSKLMTYISGTLGATVDKDEVLYLDSAGTYKKAQAAVGKVPAQGVAVAAGNNGDNILIRRIGPYTPSGAASALTLTAGGKIYIDASTAGMWTQTKPTAFSQAIGLALTASIAFIWVEDMSAIHYASTNPGTTDATGYEDGTVYLQYTA